MRAGELRHAVTIEAPVLGEPDAFNERKLDYVPQEELFAEVLDLTGRELERAKQVQADATVSVRMRHCPHITAKHRIKFGDRLLYIVGPPRDTDGRGAEQIVFCQEKA